MRKPVAAQGVPPAADGLHGELGCVGGVADADPAGVVGDVVDAVGDGLGELSQRPVGEVVHADPLGLPGGLRLGAAVGVGPDQFLLLGVHADHRLPGGAELAGQRVEVGELGVAVGVLGALVLLGRRLQRVAHLVQQPAHQLRGRLEALPGELACELARRLQRPAQRRHRAAPRDRMHQLVERLEQTGLLVDRRAVPAARSALTVRRLDPSAHLAYRPRHRRSRDPRRSHNERLPAAAQRLGHRAGHHTPLTLAQMRHDGLEEHPRIRRRKLHTPDTTPRVLSCGET